jgi:hypothetical protein
VIRKTGWIAMIALLLMCAVVCRVTAQTKPTVSAGPGTHIYDNTTQIMMFSLNDDIYIFVSTTQTTDGTHIYDSVPMAFLVSAAFGLITGPVPFGW